MFCLVPKMWLLRAQGHSRMEESYHEKGIVPDTTVDLSEEAKKQPILLLPQNMDAQLNTAAQLLLADQ